MLNIEQDNDTCNFPSTSDPTATVQIIIFNRHEEVPNNDWYDYFIANKHLTMYVIIKIVKNVKDSNLKSTEIKYWLIFTII